jgi:thiol-disulfide isomerase/thioredoxin
MRSYFFLLLLFLPLTALSQKTLMAGDTVRGIHIGAWVQDSLPGETPFAGKTLVLDFWSTWCVPCVKAIPHLNALAEEFAGDNVVFAAVSNERAVTVSRFLEKTEMKASVFVDTENSLTHKIFGVRAIPRTFIIAPDRVVRWTGHPDRLTGEILRQHTRRH